MREAFRLLSRERLVVYNLHRGVAVRELDEHDVARSLPHPRAARADGGRVQRRRPARGASRRCWSSSRRPSRRRATETGRSWRRSISHFHQRLVELIGSERISDFFRVIDAELRLAFAMVEHAPDLFRPFIPRNRAIAELLLAGDRAAAAGGAAGLPGRGRAHDPLRHQPRCLTPSGPQHDLVARREAVSDTLWRRSASSKLGRVLTAPRPRLQPRWRPW